MTYDTRSPHTVAGAAVASGPCLGHHHHIPIYPQPLKRRYGDTMQGYVTVFARVGQAAFGIPDENMADGSANMHGNSHSALQDRERMHQLLP